MLFKHRSKLGMSKKQQGTIKFPHFTRKSWSDLFIYNVLLKKTDLTKDIRCKQLYKIKRYMPFNMFHCVMLKAFWWNLECFLVFAASVFVWNRHITAYRKWNTKKVGDEDVEICYLSGQVIFHSLGQSSILLHSHLSWQLDKSVNVTTRSMLEHPTLPV